MCSRYFGSNCPKNQIIAKINFKSLLIDTLAFRTKFVSFDF